MVDTVALNAGAGLYVYGIVHSIEDGYHMAKKKISTGTVIQTLDAWAKDTSTYNWKKKANWDMKSKKKYI